MPILILILAIIIFLIMSSPSISNSFSFKNFIYGIFGIILIFFVIRFFPILFNYSTLLAIFLISTAYFLIRKKNLLKTNYINESNTDDWAYKILGVDENSSQEVIKKKYKDLMKQIHPDIGGTSDGAKELTEAKNFLLNKIKMRKK